MKIILTCWTMYQGLWTPQGSPDHPRGAVIEAKVLRTWGKSLYLSFACEIWIIITVTIRLL